MVKRLTAREIKKPMTAAVIPPSSGKMTQIAIDEAKATVTFYKEKDGTECYYKEEAGKWLVYRKADNKTIKSINYSPANLVGILSK